MFNSMRSIDWWLEYSMIAAILILVCSILLLFLKNKPEKKSRKKKIKKSGVETKPQKVVNEIKEETLISKEKEIAKPIVDINKNEIIIDYKERKLSNQNNFFESNTINNNNVFFYMTKPVDNYFPDSAKSNTSADTVYKFHLGSNNNASFEVHTLGAPIFEIIKRAETYLVPACIEENIAKESTKKIVTIKKGTVRLENNKWIIINKALIKYE